MFWLLPLLSDNFCGDQNCGLATCDYRGGSEVCYIVADQQTCQSECTGSCESINPENNQFTCSVNVYQNTKCGRFNCGKANCINFLDNKYCAIFDLNDSCPQQCTSCLHSMSSADFNGDESKSNHFYCNHEIRIMESNRCGSFSCGLASCLINGSKQSCAIFSGRDNCYMSSCRECRSCLDPNLCVSTSLHDPYYCTQSIVKDSPTQGCGQAGVDVATDEYKCAIYDSQKECQKYCAHSCQLCYFCEDNEKEQFFCPINVNSSKTGQTCSKDDCQSAGCDPVFVSRCAIYISSNKCDSICSTACKRCTYEVCQNEDQYYCPKDKVLTYEPRDCDTRCGDAQCFNISGKEMCPLFANIDECNTHCSQTCVTGVTGSTKIANAEQYSYCSIQKQKSTTLGLAIGIPVGIVVVAVIVIVPTTVILCKKKKANQSGQKEFGKSSNHQPTKQNIAQAAEKQQYSPPQHHNNGQSSNYQNKQPFPQKKMYVAQNQGFVM